MKISPQDHHKLILDQFTEQGADKLGELVTKDKQGYLLHCYPAGCKPKIP